MNAIHFSDFLFGFQEKLALRQQLNEAKQQLLQQAEYCTEMGAAACTLLWGVSSSEEVVKAILGGVSVTSGLSDIVDHVYVTQRMQHIYRGAYRLNPFLLFTHHIVLDYQLSRVHCNLVPWGVCKVNGVRSPLPDSVPCLWGYCFSIRT